MNSNILFCFLLLVAVIAISESQRTRRKRTTTTRNPLSAANTTGRRTRSKSTRTTTTTTKTTSTTTTTATTSTTTLKNYEKFEYTRFINPYDEMNNIPVEDCLSTCTADIRCKAISYLHGDRVGLFGWWGLYDACWLFESSNPDITSEDKTYFTSYVRLFVVNSEDF